MSVGLFHTLEQSIVVRTKHNLFHKSPKYDPYPVTSSNHSTFFGSLWRSLQRQENNPCTRVFCTKNLPWEEKEPPY